MKEYFVENLRMYIRHTHQIRGPPIHNVQGVITQSHGRPHGAVREHGSEDCAVPGLVENRPYLNRLGDTHGAGDEDRGSAAHKVEEAVYFDEEGG